MKVPGKREIAPVKAVRSEGRLQWRVIATSLLLLLGSGTLAAQTPGGITDRGAITQWLLLGPYQQAEGCSPSVDQKRLDYLTDGVITGDTWTPQEGDEVASECGGAASCVAWDCDAAAMGDPTLDCSTSPLPRVLFFDAPHPLGYIDLNALWGPGDFGDAPNGGAPDNMVAYAWSYVVNTTGAPISTTIGHNSDDSYRILVNFEELVNPVKNECRPPEPTVFDQETLGPVLLEPGINVIMTETWEAGGHWGFRIRLIDEATEAPLGSPDIEISPCPPDRVQCILITRDIPDTLVNGTSGLVTLTVYPLLGSGVVVINEKLPAGLTASNPSHNGVVAGDTVTWNLGRVETQIVVSYTMTAALDAADGRIGATATVDGAAVPIGGDTSYTGSPLTLNGFIKLWNHLGPLAWAHPARAGDDGATGSPGACSALDANNVSQLELDWIVNEDGTVTEKNIYPFPGLVTRPKYGGDGQPGGTGARAAGLTVAAGATGLVVRDRFPVWKGSLTRSDTINHASKEVHGFDAEDHLTLSSVYVTNRTNAPIDTNLGIGSDDSIQILLGDVDVTAGGLSECRGWGAANEEQNTFPVTLPVGESRLLVKVTDGCCGSGFRLRFQDPADPTGPGLMGPRITISLESEVKPRPGDVARSLSKDSIGLGETVDVTLNVSMKAASNVLVREVLPDHTQASVISDGGALSGNTIEWNLAQVTQKTLSYKLAVGPCAGDLSYGQSTFKLGSTEVVVSGQSKLTRTYRNDSLGTAWKSLDIGNAGGSDERLGDHEALVNASGAGVRLTRDEFHFVSLAQTGDFEISARIDCFGDPGQKGLAGLTVRDSLEPGAANAFFGLISTPPTGGGLGTLKVSFRQDLNKTTSQVTTLAAADKDVTKLPIYLKIARTGSTVSFHRSDDGLSYREITQKNNAADTKPIILKPDVVVGLGVSGGGGGSTRADFQAVSGPPFGGVVVARFRRGDTDGSGVLDLTDATSVLGRLFLGAAEPACLDAADADDSGVLDLTDAIYSLGWQFTGGAVPPAPGPTACGPDPSADNFKACVYPGC